MSRISQEFYCGECSGYFVVRLNIALNHEAEIVCPNCGHEHCRVVRNGIITEARWDRRNGGYANFNAQYYTTGVAYSSSSVYTTYVVNSGSNASTAAFSYASWNNGGTGSQGYC